jgi:hypothetical protein
MKIFLAINIFVYGFIKIFFSQFNNDFSNSRLSELKGQQLTWAFYGFSHNYEIII